MATYAFQNITASLVGPGVAIDLGMGSSAAEEGISVTMSAPRNEKTMGADGNGMHSLKADKSGTVTVRLLETSSRNALLQAAFNVQQNAPEYWGANVITIRNRGNNETTVCRGCAFQGQPEIKYGAVAGIKEWVFDCLKIDTVTGVYPVDVGE